MKSSDTKIAAPSEEARKEEAEAVRVIRAKYESPFLVLPEDLPHVLAALQSILRCRDYLDGELKRLRPVHEAAKRFMEKVHFVPPWEVAAAAWAEIIAPIATALNAAEAP